MSVSPLKPVDPHKPASGHGHGEAREKLTAIGVFISFLLALTLIGLGERGIYDLNRLYNQHYQNCSPARYLITRGASCPVEEYAFKQLLLHSYVTLPLSILALGLMLYLRKRRLATWQKALFRVSSIVAIFFGIQFVLEVIIFLWKFHRLIGIYVTYLLLAALLVTLLIYLERRSAKKKSAGGGHH